MFRNNYFYLKHRVPSKECAEKCEGRKQKQIRIRKGINLANRDAIHDLVKQNTGILRNVAQYEILRVYNNLKLYTVCTENKNIKELDYFYKFVFLTLFLA